LIPPYVIGPPGIGSRTGLSASASAGAKKKAPEPDSAAAAAAAAAKEAGRAKRRQRAPQRGYGDEYMDMNVDVEPDWDEPATTASDRGAGNLGFVGAARKETAAAAGLTTLSGGEFGGGPSMPMLPGSWDPEGNEGPHDSDG
jgi:PPE-repeat protein